MTQTGRSSSRVFLEAASAYSGKLVLVFVHVTLSHILPLYADVILQLTFFVHNNASTLSPCFHPVVMTTAITRCRARLVPREANVAWQPSSSQLSVGKNVLPPQPGRSIKSLVPAHAAVRSTGSV